MLPVSRRWVLCQDVESENPRTEDRDVDSTIEQFGKKSVHQIPKRHDPALMFGYQCAGHVVHVGVQGMFEKKMFRTARCDG